MVFRTTKGGTHDEVGFWAASACLGAEVPGCWVAVDRITGEPVAVSSSPYTLAAELRSRQIKNVAVVRAPDPSEPELVGLG